MTDAITNAGGMPHAQTDVLLPTLLGFGAATLALSQ
jgi:hypothetical protein